MSNKTRGFKKPSPRLDGPTSLVFRTVYQCLEKKLKASTSEIKVEMDPIKNVDERKQTVSIDVFLGLQSKLIQKLTFPINWLSEGKDGEIQRPNAGSPGPHSDVK